jgi:NDP-sugar pyrophosphorylase family protein
MRAIILAGGRGARLAPFTGVFPKPLMPVGASPILETILRQLRHHGFTDIVLSVGHMAELIELYFGDGRRFGVDLTYCEESEPLGTAGPLALVPPIDEPVLVMNADVLSTIDYGDLYRQHLRKRPALTIGLYPKEVKIELGVLDLNDVNEVVQYTEKPTFSYRVSMGIYVVDPETHRQVFRRGRRRLDLPDLVSILIRAERRIDAYRFEGYWLDIGKPADYEKACVEFERLREQFLPPVPQLHAIGETLVTTRRRLPRRDVLVTRTAAV